MASKQDYNPLLNFKENKNVKLPDWFIFPVDGVNMICGPGDYVHNNKTNVEQFKEFDIFVCFGDDDIPKEKVKGELKNAVYTSVDENVEWLKTNPQGKNKLLCLIDIYNYEQVSMFIDIFGGKVKFLTSQTNSPIFNPLECVSLLKKPGGIVELTYITKHGHGYGIYAVEKTKWFEFFKNNKIYDLFGEIIDPKTGFLTCSEIKDEQSNNSYILCERTNNAFEYQASGGFKLKTNTKKKIYKKRIHKSTKHKNTKHKNTKHIKNKKKTLIN